MKISVVIPNLNSLVIDQTLSALERQTFPRQDFQVIVIGMDEPSKVYENDLIHFWRSDVPLSPAVARNRGAFNAEGEIIAFTDSDCIPAPNWLEVFSDRFNSVEIGIVGGGVTFDTQNYWTLSDNLNMFYEYLAEHPPGLRSLLPSLNLAMRKALFVSVGGFDERYPRASGEDADLSIRLRLAGHPLYFEPRAVVNHCPQRNSLSGLIWHSYYQGLYSTKVDPRYRKTEKTPLILQNAVALQLLSPMIALFASTRLFVYYPKLTKFWYTLPAIFLAKMAWCFGAANHPEW